MLKKALLENQKLEQLAALEGFDNSEDLLIEHGFDGTVPAICMNENCEAVYYYEPDQVRGWCDECETNSVKSCLVLGGLI